MAESISSVNGLASGIQWKDLVDQLMTIDQQRNLDPVNAKKTLQQSRVDAWKQFQTLAAKFRDAARALRDGTAFATYKVTGGTSPSTGRALFTASANIGASPGNYSVEVLDVARSNKLSGNVVASATSALGLAGEFAVNGQKVTVLATDTLASLRDKINALNTGTTPTGVSASVLSTGATQNRLVLTSDSGGASGIELTDDAGGVLQSLGVVDATKTLNIDSTGGTQTQRVNSATAAIAAMLGVSMPPPSTIEIGGRTIAVDLTVDSLSTIAARIMAAGGNASVTTETSGGKSSYRLVTSDTVSASTPDGQRALEVLGFVKNGRSGISQVVTSESSYTDGSGAAATASTLLTDLSSNGNPLGLVAGDTFAIQGQRGDGTAVSVSLTIGAGDTLQTLVDKINNNTNGFGSTSRTATASIQNGKLVVTDNSAGDSLLSLSVLATRASNGTTVSLGRQLTSAVGRQREVVAGTDAVLKIDGVAVRRSTNTISDALSGVTINVSQAEIGTTTNLTVDRDVDAVTTKVKDIATAYNAILKFRADQQKDGQPLRNDPTVRSSIASITSTLLSNVSGLTGGFTRSGSAGLALQGDGSLALDEANFKKLLNSNFTDLNTLFGTNGKSTNPEMSYWTSTTKSVPGTYAVNITAAATVPSVTGTGFSGTYADDGTPDTMSITDATSGVTGTISLANGDSTDTIVGKLNSLFATSHMAISASKSGNDVVLTGTRYGTAATFTIAYTPGGADGTAQLGIAAATLAGTDVAGTIGGVAARGAGQILTGTPPITGQPTEGLGITYTGTALGAIGDLTFTLGLAGTLFNVSDSIAAPDGTAYQQTQLLNKSITDLGNRADTLQQQLDRKRAALVKQFTAMETAISRIQQQGTSLTSFINSLNASSNN